MSEWTECADQLTKNAKRASRLLALADGQQKQRWLKKSAELMLAADRFDRYRERGRH